MLAWATRGIALDQENPHGWTKAGYELTRLHRELWTRLGRGNQAIEAAWPDLREEPGKCSYDELMKLVPKTGRTAWHEKAMDAAKGTDLRALIELFIETKEMERLAELVRGATDEALEQASHYATEPAAKKLERAHPGLAARLWRAQGMRIVDGAKSKYYDAALSNFERARRCYERAGLAAEWADTVRHIELGPSGVFKSALAALCQQHFGATMNGGSLPANFASTGNALEWLAFYTKDALLVVDDFAPSGRGADAALQNVAERLFRAAGNQQGRSRMGGDGQPHAPKLPRALILATGEEVPQGQSIRARLVIVEVRAGEVDRTRLSECQCAGREGQLAESMGAFVRWIAGRYEEVQGRLQNRALEIRSQGCGRTVHARLPSALAELQTGWEMFLQFAQEVGAIGLAEKAELEQRSVKALGRLAAMQAKYQVGNDPALRFVGLLQAALSCGRAHVADPRGKPPPEAEQWGWQPKPRGRGCEAQGTRIGWLAGNDLFLDPAVSYQVAQEMAGAKRIPVSEQTLRQRLRQLGLLASIDAGRGMVQVRRTLEGHPRQVLHVKAKDLIAPV